MLAYTIRRFLLAIPVLIGITFLVWVIAIANPSGGPTAALLGRGTQKTIRPEQIQALLHRYGLDQPLPVQYFHWVTNFLRGDWGISYFQHEAVSQLIAERAIPTLLLGGLAFLISEVIAIPLGVFSAVRRGSLFDQIFSFLAYFFFSLPTFWFGLMAIVVFGVLLNWLPFQGMTDISKIGTGFGTPAYWVYFRAHPITEFVDIGAHLILPVTILSLIGLATDSRFLRGQMLEVLGQDYVRTAKAKGLSQNSVIWKHAARNALLPLITSIGLTLPTLIGGAVITESLFSWPGMGLLFITAAQGGDYPIVMAYSVLIGFLVVIFNILTDLAYAVVDPRIRYS